MGMTLIENWARDWWRLASMWFIWLAGAFISWTTAYPKDWQALLDLLPDQYRPFVVFIVFAATGSVLRMTTFKRGK